MQFRISLILFGAALAAFAVPARLNALDLYVATNGRDTASGRAPTMAQDGNAGPFATLTRARNEIRHLKAAGPLSESTTVNVRQGVYELPETFALEAPDSGTEAHPIVYRGYQNERPTLSGGRKITGFEPYQGAILKVDLSTKAPKAMAFKELYFDGKRQWPARYPNADPKHPISGGWAYADGDPIPIYQDVPGENKHTLLQRSADVHSWSHPEDGEVFVFPRFNWWNNLVPIKSVDRQARTITINGDASYAIRPHDRYYVSNLFEELDAPGEWFFDKRTRILYFIPPETMNGKSVTVPALSTVVNIKPGAAWLTIRGFVIECAAWDAVKLRDTEHCLIAGNVVRNSGGMHGNGISVNGGHDDGVVGNDISQIGNSGISLTGGTPLTLTSANHYADNNYIHHIGLCYKQGVGISLAGVGNRASHNLIHDGPRFAIVFSGNKHVLEYNHMRHIALETEDVGATYCGGRDWISPRGSIIRYNFIHDVLGFARVTNGKTTSWVSPRFSWGVYLDDNSGGVDVIGNIVARCGRSLFHGHSARDSVVDNNIFVDGGEAQWELNGWNKTGKNWKEHFSTMTAGFESVLNQPAWKGMRGMQVHPKDIPDSEGRVICGNVVTHNVIAWTKPDAKPLNVREFNPARNSVDNNLYWHGGLPVTTGIKAGKAILPWESWQANGSDRHSVIADPLFRNAAKDDYRLDKASPAWALGFKPIPIERIGPYADPLRASWPIVEVPGVREWPRGEY